MQTLKDVIQPKLKGKIKPRGVSNFLPKLDPNKKYQESIWSGKTYKVDPETHVFTTIQEHFGNRMLKKISLPDNSVVVDIGSFIGEKLWQLKGNKKYLGIGVDISIPALIAADEIDKYGHKFIAADLENLPFKDNSIDLIIIFDVIEHLTSAKRGFSEIARVLRPNGRLLLHVPISDNKYSLFWFKQQLFPHLAQKDYSDVGHSKERMLSTKQIINHINESDMTLRNITYYNSFFVHFWDREFVQIASKILVLLTKKGKSIANQERSVHTGSVGKIRVIYGKVVVPVLEILSFPDLLLAKLKIGNTAFFLASKNE